MPIPIDPDSDALRLVAQFCGLAPSRLAPALSDPERLPLYLSGEEFTRLGEGMGRLGNILQAIKTAALVIQSHIDEGHHLDPTRPA